MTQTKTTGLKQATMNILNGIGMGVIASLVPAAILGQLMKALLGVAPAFSQTVINITTFTQWPWASSCAGSSLTACTLSARKTCALTSRT